MSADERNVEERASRAAERSQRAQETLEVLARLHRRPTLEAALDLQEIHAKHERELGHDEIAKHADERVRAARERLERASRRPGAG